MERPDDFSNHWKSRMGGTAVQLRFFQSLELFLVIFPIIGKIPGAEYE